MLTCPLCHANPSQVTRQLFEPLVMQLIHWFTNNKKFESQDTVAVLEAIMVRIHDSLLRCGPPGSSHVPSGPVLRAAWWTRWTARSETFLAAASKSL